MNQLRETTARLLIIVPVTLLIIAVPGLQLGQERARYPHRAARVRRWLPAEAWWLSS